MILILSKFE